jgi:hypothetical protein
MWMMRLSSRFIRKERLIKKVGRGSKLLSNKELMNSSFR